MNALDELFVTLKSKNEGAFMPFVTLGDPDQEISIQIIKKLIESGADILELGIPFSDPIADGKTIQRSGQRALKMGMNTDRAFEMVKKIREFSSIPILFLTYYNLVLQFPPEEFFNKCKQTDVQGIVIADLPVEEADVVLRECERTGTHLIFLVAPNTTEKRFTKILEHAGGFIYFVSIYGTTGARDHVEQSTFETLLRLSSVSNLPILPGFGISSPTHVKELMGVGADGVIVGSAIIKRIEENLNDPDKMLAEIGTFARDLKEATKKGGKN